VKAWKVTFADAETYIEGVGKGCWLQGRLPIWDEYYVSKKTALKRYEEVSKQIRKLKGKRLVEIIKVKVKK
jgi:hypothetical protein